jgi:hypothetical protein
MLSGVSVMALVQIWSELGPNVGGNATGDASGETPLFCVKGYNYAWYFSWGLAARQLLIFLLLKCYRGLVGGSEVRYRGCE